MFGLLVWLCLFCFGCCLDLTWLRLLEWIVFDCYLLVCGFALIFWVYVCGLIVL